MFALPGGFIDVGETVENAVIREAKEETGLDIEIIKILGIYSDPKRDPRGHTVSICFIATGHGDLNAGDDAGDVGLFDIDKVPELAFDHNKIIEDAIRNINWKDDIIIHKMSKPDDVIEFHKTLENIFR